jgi:glycosyltransferase involved in cell wall biosynthesis
VPRDRIAEVSTPWLPVPPRTYGGIELMVSLLTDGLVERGHDVTLFATGDSRTRARLDYVLEEAPGLSDANSPWHETIHALYAFRDPERFDLYHIHPTYATLAAAAHSGRPVLHTLHGPFTERRRRLYRLVADRVWFVAISEAQRAAMPELRYAGVVHNGVDPDRYRFRSQKEDFLLFVGRCAPEKGPLRAVDAARAAGLPLVIVPTITRSWEDEYWHREVLPSLPPDATVMPELDFAGKVDLMSRARALLFPVDWEEPFGLVMVEAMASGTPVIGTPLGSVPEVVVDGETGFVVSLEDYAEEAREALGRIGQIDPAACRTRVLDRFSSERMVTGYEEAFAAVLGSA